MSYNIFCFPRIPTVSYTNSWPEPRPRRGRGKKSTRGRDRARAGPWPRKTLFICVKVSRLFWTIQSDKPSFAARCPVCRHANLKFWWPETFVKSYRLRCWLLIFFKNSSAGFRPMSAAPNEVFVWVHSLFMLTSLDPIKKFSKVFLLVWVERS